VERVRKGQTRAGDPISGSLSGIEDVPTDPIRHNIPGWSDYPLRIKNNEKL
jgi:hypothetical protein